MYRQKSEKALLGGGGQLPPPPPFGYANAQGTQPYANVRQPMHNLHRDYADPARTQPNFGVLGTPHNATLRRPGVTVKALLNNIALNRGTDAGGKKS